MKDKVNTENITTHPTAKPLKYARQARTLSDAGSSAGAFEVSELKLMSAYTVLLVAVLSH